MVFKNYILIFFQKLGLTSYRLINVSIQRRQLFSFSASSSIDFSAILKISVVNLVYQKLN